MVLTAGTASNQTENDSAPLKVVNKKKRKSPDEDHSSSTVKQKSESKEESKKVKFNEKVEYSEPEKKKRRQSSSDENDKSAAGDSSADDGEESGKKKLNNKQLKKLKQKRKEAKKRKGEAKRQKKLEEGVVTPQKHRDFATDLTEYLQQWEDDMRKLNSSEKKWKFNKVLQEWALQHCLQKQLVSSELFKKLTPYIATVQGKAKERLVTVLQEVMNREDEAVPETTEGDEGETLAILRSIEKKRAKRLLPLLTSE
jgi:hypothetical protein